jgi:site-specific DNA recombinase
MKIADLYIRVSTDEQADKGYSQRSQEEFLRKYCDINKIAIRNVIFEDHSAKTFNRPEWSKYLLEIKKNKCKTDLVLFLKWDRFSRNAGDAYQMINLLRKLGVEPQAIEQPLDLSVPENKMMLAFYLAAPEVENDRRALNVIHGMRRARKEGRYMGRAPIGYTNRTDQSGRKFIAPEEPQAGIIRWAFQQISQGVYNTEQIYKKSITKGFSGTKGLFWFAIRNPVYCGRIFIPKYKDEESRFVKGTHEPLVPEILFNEVQDVLDGRKRNNYKLKVVSNASLPLRGFLLCPDCGKILTGSASKGMTQYYSYYHCTTGCKCRMRADNANDKFVAELRKYIPKQEVAELFKEVIAEAWEEQTTHHQDDSKQLRLQIKELEEKLSYIRDLLSSKQIEPADFREMKTEYSNKLEKLEVKLSATKHDEINIKTLLDTGVNNLLKLDHLYEIADIEKKREIISSIYPEKLTFDGNEFRTIRINEAIRLIYSIGAGCSENKNRTNRNKSNLSCEVGMARFELATSWSQTRRDNRATLHPERLNS